MVDPQPVPEGLPAKDVLEIAAPMLAEVGGTWQMTDGPMLRSGSLGVRVLPADSDDYRHLDLEILLNAARTDVPTIVDCTVGVAADPVEAARQAIGAWIETCAVTVLEMIEQQGRLASHFRSGDQGGVSGWHAIVGSITGWSVDGSQDKQEWFAEAMPWSILAPVITTGLDRPHLNGVRMLVGQGGDFTECEVRINGRRHEPSSAALAALDWPRTSQFGLARTFVLLVGPE
ncbi:hypothetical protein Rhe02_73380 [Rhizocola hellebori]|uniref:Uncharacterized protein n=2 Tax=Rhizocola hellebori TaxID=1392758 RepID=A0A8J3QEI6_9ACTN|nr:hypothetical protein Rhe02_73380 [Rhizocola hellebori]